MNINQVVCIRSNLFAEMCVGVCVSSKYRESYKRADVS